MNTDFEITWNGALETARARSEQRHPEVHRRGENMAPQLVLAYLQESPGATVHGASDALGMSKQQVNSVLNSLLLQGLVTRSHRKCEDVRKPVRWWAR